jgi:hypothetical protein
MSRSRKHLPITGIAAGTDKLAKRWWNRSFRRRTRHLIAKMRDYEALALPMNIHKETEYWDGPKETKVWRPHWPKVYRK